MITCEADVCTHIFTYFDIYNIDIRGDFWMFLYVNFPKIARNVNLKTEMPFLLRITYINFSYCQSIDAVTLDVSHTTDPEPERLAIRSRALN